MPATTEHLADLTVADLVRRTTSGEVSALAVTEACLERIAERDPHLNAFSVVLAEEAGAVKEELDVAGCVTTFGGRGNSTPAAQDGEVVRRLREAGAVIIGKTRMPEFGQWPFTESVDGGLTRNPWDPTRTPGGSSGGTAVAVAAGMVPVGIGGDGGGSIRIPSACCGLFGLKPERGRVTSAPMEHLWWALGTAGPLSRTVLDSAIVYDVIRGSAPGDRFRAVGPRVSFVEGATAPTERLRVGWSVKPAARGVRPDPQHVRAVQDVAQLLTDLGHDVRELDVRWPDPTAAFVPQFLGGVRAEADEVEHFERLERRTRQVYRLGAWVRRPVLDRALRAGERIGETANRVFDDVDVVLTPTIAHRPGRLGRLERGGPVTASLRSMPMIAYTALWNVTGNPAASVPVGTGTDGLPLAVQLVGRHDDEPTLLGLAAELEQARPWSMPTTEARG